MNSDIYIGKTCRKCGIILTFENRTKNRRICKKCINLYNKMYYKYGKPKYEGNPCLICSMIMLY